MWNFFSFIVQKYSTTFLLLEFPHTSWLQAGTALWSHVRVVALVVVQDPCLSAHRARHTCVIFATDLNRYKIFFPVVLFRRSVGQLLDDAVFELICCTISFFNP